MAHKFVLSAIKKKDVKKALQLVQMPGYDVNIGVENVTPLMLASKLGLITVAESLVILGADVNLEDSDGQSALFYACSHGNSQLVEVLLEAGCDVNKIKVNGDQPLHEAIASGDLDTVKCLIAAGASKNRPNSITGYTPLILAILHANPSIVDCLLSAGVLPSKSMSGGETPLHFAVQVSPLEIISMLIKAGSDLNILNQIGESPLVMSICEGRIDVARLLILCGSSLYHYNYFSPLSVACMQNNPQMILYLLSEGYNVSRDESVKQNIFYRLENEHQAVHDFIYLHRCVQPLSLKESSRLIVRQCLGPDMSSHLQKLPIPDVLRTLVGTDVIYNV
ncbi:ankyrin repeat domain-containing protein 17-like [Gigantopelta aegis]|uniref:ankyrin repeat domain-containing protein 17-like n=1 Tax=Gigantopelta aegis TaxID=1735272 RepID=UPI001B888C44|nr:ankyrin repeat domain-containing protein 17-like [Gigantopelta aegis]